MNIFQLGSSVTVDPLTRKVTLIDGVAPTEEMQEEHADALQAFADQACAATGVETAQADLPLAPST